MKPSRNLKIAAALALGLTTAGVAMAQSMKAEDAITARRATMRVIDLNFRPLGAMAKGKMPYNAELAKANAERMRQVSMMPFETYFPDGSDQPAGDLNTRALVEIWLNMDDFKKKLGAMRDEATKLAAVAGNGADALKAQVGATGKACKSCHDDYRSK